MAPSGRRLRRQRGQGPGCVHDLRTKMLQATSPKAAGTAFLHILALTLAHLHAPPQPLPVHAFLFPGLEENKLLPACFVNYLAVVEQEDEEGGITTAEGDACLLDPLIKRKRITTTLTAH